MLIGIIGDARHGKDSIGDVLVELYGFEREKFATPLYELLDAAGVAARKRQHLVDLGNTVRKHSPYFLVDSMSRRLAEHKRTASIVITDVRDDIEAGYIKRRNGKLWCVTRYIPWFPDRLDNYHADLFDSGVCDVRAMDSLRDVDCDRHFNNFSLDQLRRDIVEEMNKQ